MNNECVRSLSPLKSNSMDTAWHMRLRLLQWLLAFVMSEEREEVVAKNSDFYETLCTMCTMYITSVCAYHPLLSCQCLFYFREYLSEMDASCACIISHFFLLSFFWLLLLAERLGGS